MKYNWIIMIIIITICGLMIYMINKSTISCPEGQHIIKGQVETITSNGSKAFVERRWCENY